jgi:hypothetical protein
VPVSVGGEIQQLAVLIIIGEYSHIEGSLHASGKTQSRKKDSPVQSSLSLNWGELESCQSIRRREILSGSNGKGNQGF